MDWVVWCSGQHLKVWNWRETRLCSVVGVTAIGKKYSMGLCGAGAGLGSGGLGLPNVLLAWKGSSVVGSSESA